MILNGERSKKVRFGTCSKDCYGSCVFLGYWEDEASEFKFKSAKPLKQHQFTKGFFCAKYNQRERMIYHPQRIKKPLIRDDSKGINRFSVIDLENALEIIAEKILHINHRFGPKSILLAFNSGNYGLISRFAPLRFAVKLGSSITTGGICNEGGCAGLTQLFGTYSTTNPFQLNNPALKLIFVWGSDLSNRNVHAYHLIKQAQKRGVKLIVVDSRKTEIGQKADLFIYTKPGTDHMLANLIVKGLIQARCIDNEFLSNYVDGYEQILSQALKLNEEKIRELLEINHDSINSIIKLLIEFKHHTIFNVGYGVQKDFYGGRIVQSIALIQIILGNFGIPGSGLIYSQSDFNNQLIVHLLDYITQKTPDSNIVETDLIKLGTTLSSDKYKMVFIYNFNPASSLPHQKLIINALMRKDLFVVVLECFLNETTKYANIVIPSKFDLETNDLITPYYIPGISINQGGPCPYQDCVSNYEFFRRLSSKIGFKNDPIFYEDENSLYNKCLALLPLEIQKRVEDKGYYLLFDQNTVPFKTLHFPTPNGRIQIHSIKFDFGKERLEDRLKCKKNEFLLITPSHKYYIHSQFGQLHREYLDVFKKIFLCSLDIEKLGFKIGEKVLVSNDLGSATYFLEENNTLNSGVALIYSGSPLGLEKSVNVNIFTSNRPEELGFSGAYNSAKILISKKE
ncbi:MAG: molybdopterin-dependent oxidoreductase [Candidatus Hermodarchaeota archaeon]